MHPDTAGLVEDLGNQVQEINLHNYGAKLEARRDRLNEEVLSESSGSPNEAQEVDFDDNVPIIDYKTFNLNDDGYPLSEEELKRNCRLQKKAYIRGLGQDCFDAAILSYAELKNLRKKLARDHLLTYGTPEIMTQLVYGDEDTKVDASGLLKLCADYNVHPSSLPWWDSLLQDNQDR